MDDSTHAQRCATGLAAIEYAEILGQPLTQAALALVTNHDLLIFVFGDDEETSRPILASFKGNPKDAPHSAWAPHAWWSDITAHAPEANNYLALNRYAPMRGTTREDFYFSRREMLARSMYGLLLDDVRDWRSLGLAPTWVVETSEGNFQVVYLFDRPLAGAELLIGKALGQALIDKGWSDPAAGSPTTRFMRLPVGVNGKTTPPYRVALRFLAPGNRYSVGELRDGLGLTLKTMKPFQAPPPPERLRGELGEVQVLVEAIDVQAMDRKHWTGFMHALRGACGAQTREGEALAVQASWNAAESEIGETLRFWRTIDVKGLRSGIDELRHMGARHPDPTQVFDDVEAEATKGAGSALLHASRREAEAVVAKVAAAKPELAILADTPAVAPMAKYIVKGIFHQLELLLLHGASGSAKTFLIVDMAVHLAAGREWFGHRVAAGIGVLIVANEDALGVQERLHACAAHLGVDTATLPIAFTLVPTNMRGDEKEASARITRMRKAVAKRFDVKHYVVIFDTLAASWLGLDDNSPEDMGEVVAHCLGVKAASMSPVLVHHHGKDASKGPRGHTSLLAATDAALELKYDKETLRYSMLVTKRRKGPTGRTWDFSLQEVRIGTDPEGDDITTAVIKRLDETDCAVTAGQARRAKERALPPGVVVVEQALYKAIAESGEVCDAGPVHGVHQAVCGELWKSMYLAGRPAGSRQERNTALAAFLRGLDRLQKEGHVGEYQGMFWLV